MTNTEALIALNMIEHVGPIRVRQMLEYFADATAILQWLRRAPLDGGVAAEIVDVDGRAVANGGDASLSGLLAWSMWYTVNALGERP